MPAGHLQVPRRKPRNSGLSASSMASSERRRRLVEPQVVDQCQTRFTYARQACSASPASSATRGSPPAAPVPPGRRRSQSATPTLFSACDSRPGSPSVRAIATARSADRDALGSAARPARAAATGCSAPAPAAGSSPAPPSTSIASRPLALRLRPGARPTSRSATASAGPGRARARSPSARRSSTASLLGRTARRRRGRWCSTRRRSPPAAPPARSAGTAARCSSTSR